MNVSQEGWTRYLRKKRNQIWKILPLREEGGDWVRQSKVVSSELRGLSIILSPLGECNMIEVVSKLEGLESEHDFSLFRKNVFDILTLIEELEKYEGLQFNAQQES